MIELCYLLVLTSLLTRLRAKVVGCKVCVPLRDSISVGGYTGYVVVVVVD